MKNILSLIAAVLLAFIAVSLLMTAVQYSSYQVSIGYQNETAYTADIGSHGQSNTMTGDSPDNSSGPPDNSMSSDGSAWSRLNLSILSFSGGGPKDPDKNDQNNYLWVLLILILLIVVVLLGIIGYLIMRRRRPSLVAPPPHDQGIIPFAYPASFEGDYWLRFPQITDPFPRIWGVGETLEVTIEPKEDAAREVVLDIDGYITRDIQLENGRSKFRFDLDKGDHRITIRPKDSAALSTPSWAEVRIVDYREEVVRLYNELYTGYSARNGGKLTPRELERVIGNTMPDNKRTTFSIAVTIFEIANFSLHAIKRGDYERMYLSRMDAA